VRVKAARPATYAAITVSRWREAREEAARENSLVTVVSVPVRKRLFADPSSALGGSTPPVVIDTLPFPEWIAELMDAYLEVVRPILRRDEPTDAFFLNEKGKPLASARFAGNIQLFSRKYLHISLNATQVRRLFQCHVFRYSSTAEQAGEREEKD